MTDRERLIKLIADMRLEAKGAIGSMNDPDAWFADYLLDHGVFCPPCKVGDVVYELDVISNRIEKFKIRDLYHLTRLIDDECFGEDAFFTREEAEAALARRRTEP